MIKITDEMVDVAIAAQVAPAKWPDTWGDEKDRTVIRARMRTALAAVLPLIGEECAKVADASGGEGPVDDDYGLGVKEAGEVIAAAIRKATGG